MNSSEEAQANGIINEDLPSSSQINADNNANTKSNHDQSKGAIPKNKLSTKSLGSTKKTLKINNNIEDMTTFNCVHPSDRVKRNGYSKSAPTSNYVNPSNLHLEDPDPISANKESLREHCDYNITDFLTVSYLQYPGTASLDETNNEQSVSIVSSPHVCKEHNCYNSDSSSSSDDNELLSVSDDGCIYTYKADLPNSFFNVEIPPLENLEVADNSRQGNSSPEMDFLEMDFDPGPSGDADSDSVTNLETENIVRVPQRTKEKISVEPIPCCSKKITKLDLPAKISVEEVGANINNYEHFSKVVKQMCVGKSSVPPKCETKMPWSCSLAERTQSAVHLRSVKRHHSSKGELVSPSECVSSPSGDATSSNLSSNISSVCIISKNITEKTVIPLDRYMIWTEQEACIKQVTQIAPSSCGATAVLNVLNALRISLPSPEDIQKIINTRFRANTSPLTEYLMSRSKAGCNHRDIIAGLYRASNGQIYSRFFSMYPERVVNLHKWLGYWIGQGAVPVATLNLQKCQGKIPDSWHHQMIFGVSPVGIYLTNPIECVEASQLWPQLTSESVLLIRREDVLSRWNPRTDLPQLIKMKSVRWREMNVVGQTAKIIRESRREVRTGSHVTSHIKIPADYKAGITLAIDTKSPAFTLLRQCPELPLLNPNETAVAFSVNSD